MKNKVHRVSIGMPIYNGGKFVEQALTSLLDQTYDDFELVICDNASTDETEEICRRFADGDSRIRYHRNERNLGAAPNYNLCFHLSRGEYFKWAAHDDLCGREYLERCVEVLDRRSDTILCYPKAAIIDEQGRRLQTYFDVSSLEAARPHERFRDLLINVAEGNAIFGLIRSNVLRRTPLIGDYTASDIILLAELALYGRIHEIQETLFFRRDHPEASTRANTNLDDLANWFNPNNQGKIHFTNWRWLFEHLSSIRRAPIGLSEKTLCLVTMARWVRWNAGGLAGDLKNAARRTVRRRPTGGADGKRLVKAAK